MAVNKSQNIHHENERSLNVQIPEVQTNEGTAGVNPLGLAPPQMASVLENMDHSSLHTSFMQCPKCCNCSPGCSHFGNGHFDDQGTYVGPKK